MTSGKRADGLDPSLVAIKTPFVPLPRELAALAQSPPLAGAVASDAATGARSLDVQRLQPALLKQLSPDQLRAVMQSLATIPCDATVRDREGQVVAGTGGGGEPREWNPFNPPEPVPEKGGMTVATAVAAQAWATGDMEAFARLVAAAPDAALPWITDNMENALTAESLGVLVREMAASDGVFGWDEVTALGTLVERYLENTAGADTAKIGDALFRLFERFATLDVASTPENVGTVAGVLLAGIMKRFAVLKLPEEKAKEAFDAARGKAAKGSVAPSGWGEVAVKILETGQKVLGAGGGRRRDNRELAGRWGFELTRALEKTLKDPVAINDAFRNFITALWANEFISGPA